jgi:hypothetical protein
MTNLMHPKCEKCKERAGTADGYCWPCYKEKFINSRNPNNMCEKCHEKKVRANGLCSECYDQQVRAKGLYTSCYTRNRLQEEDVMGRIDATVDCTYLIE